MSLEPSQIENVVDGELPIPAINRIITFLHALLPTSSEKSALAENESDRNVPFATSTTTRTIGMGTKVFTTVEPRNFLLPVIFVIISDAANQSNWMVGKVTSYEIATKQLTVDVQQTNGSGTSSNWKIGVSGPPSNIFYSATKRWRLDVDDSGNSVMQEI